MLRWEKMEGTNSLAYRALGHHSHLQYWTRSWSCVATEEWCRAYRPNEVLFVILWHTFHIQFLVIGGWIQLLHRPDSFDIYWITLLVWAKATLSPRARDASARGLPYPEKCAKLRHILDKCSHFTWAKWFQAISVRERSILTCPWWHRGLSGMMTIRFCSKEW